MKRSDLIISSILKNVIGDWLVSFPSRISNFLLQNIIHATFGAFTLHDKIQSHGIAFILCIFALPFKDELPDMVSLFLL